MAESLFRVSTGFSIDDNVNIMYGTAIPSAASGVVAPVGSIYMQNASGTDGGSVWCKVGESDTSWNNISASSIGLRWLASVKATTVDDVSVFSGIAEPFSDDEIGITIAVGERVASKADDKIYVVGDGTAYNITAVDIGLKQFTIAGDHTVIPGTKIKIAGSTGNNGTYTVVTSVYGTDTVVTVAEAIPDATVDGNLTNCWQLASDGALVSGDTFFSTYTFIFSSDPSLQGPYAVSYNGADLIKLAAFDFEFATTIKLSAGYTPTNGNPAAGDTVEKAVGNLDANQDDIQTTLGVAQGDTSLGAFTGTVLPDNATVKAALQAVGTQVDTNTGAISGAEGDIDDLEAAVGSTTGTAGLTYTQDNYVTDNQSLKASVDALDIGLGKARKESSAGPVTSTPIVIDSMLVDNFDAAHWLVVVYETATPAKKIAEEVYALHNGTTSADATAIDYTKYAKIKTTPNITGLSVSVTISGTGAAQVMNLVVSSTTSVMVKAVRVSV